MPRMVHSKMAAGLTMTIGALLSVAGFVVASPAFAAGPVALTDPVGDVINRETNDKLESPPTDIVSATIESDAQGIVLTFKTRELLDPATDAHWTSPNTFVSWQIDSSGDGKVDDLIRFASDRDAAGGIVADLTHWSGPGQPAKNCEVPATFSPTTGYTLTVPPNCMANPAAISYRVQLTYDTNPGGNKPPLAFDVVPEQGLAGPVPIVIATAPAAAPQAGGTPDPAAKPNPGPGQAVAPTPSASKPAPAQAGKPAPKPATEPTTPVPTRGAAGAPQPAGPGAAPATDPAGELAATGPSNSRRLGALGGVLLLLGGLGLTTPADRRRSV